MTQDMDTTVIEIADGIFRLSTYLDPPGMVFNQFLVVDEEPLLFHLGHRRLFPQVHEAVGRVLFTIPGRAQPTSGDDIGTPALDGEDRFHPTALTD
jgi:hypothetical protein